MTAKMINRAKYENLLVEVLPGVIETDHEYQAMLEHAQKLLRKTEKSQEELKLLKLLVRLIEDYETQAFPLEEVSPVEVLEELMEARDLKPHDLWEVVGSKSIVSEILNGKRGISKNKAKALGEFFHVSPALFL